MSDPQQIADAFRLALDREDWPAARRSLADDCEYLLGSKTIAGADAIVASYAESAAWGRENLDEIAYESQLSQENEETFSILFTDHLRSGDRTHTYQCRQEVVVDQSGRIVRIMHCELPGQRAALQEYFDRCGLRRD